MTLYLKQFYESPMGLLSIIVSKEGLVELDFYDPKEEAPDPYGALEQIHPYHEKVKEWLDHYFAGDPIAISFPLAPQGTASVSYTHLDVYKRQTETFQSKDTDFQAALTKIKDKDFDAIVLPGYYTETGKIVNQARGMGCLLYTSRCV